MTLGHGSSVHLEHFSILILDPWIVRSVDSPVALLGSNLGETVNDVLSLVQTSTDAIGVGSVGSGTPYWRMFKDILPTVLTFSTLTN